MKTTTVRWIALAILCGSAIAPARAEVSVSTPVLTMEEAVARSIQTNLATRLTQARSQEARGYAVQAAASLLPQVTGSVGQSRIFKTNLAVDGFGSSPLIPNPVIGPYNVFDVRIQLVQKLLDFNSIWATKAAFASQEAARLGVDLAADQVASAAALSYIESLRALKGIQAAQSDLELAQRLAAEARHRKEAGLATDVDVVRAETSDVQARQSLIQARLAAVQADLRLKRVVGIPLSDSVTLEESGDRSQPQPLPEPALISQALRDRIEIQLTREQVKAEAFGLSAAKAGFLPTFAAEADYGFSGNTPDSTARTGQIGGRLDLPFFEGGRTLGQIEEARGRRSAAESQYADTRIQVEEEVRLALQTLSAEQDEVNAAETKVNLAERELRLAADRFAAGVGDNIQVITAQTTLAEARRSHTDAWARLADAQANLAMAIGHIRTFHLQERGNL
jgi:outer membrane protein TolC